MKTRHSIAELQKQYDAGHKKPLEDLMRAWKGIKELPPTDPQSFFVLGGYHGEPFRGGGRTSSAFWGGYCNHGNILFPTWHRIYLFKLEEALQSIPGCSDVTLPFWDETSDESLTKGIPAALTQEFFDLDGVSIPNPLRSFVLNKNIADQINGDDPNYSKPLGYETVRYPLSGLVGNDVEKAATAKHNAGFPNYATNVDILNQNVIRWLTTKTIVIDPAKPLPANVHQKFVDCLSAPNYMLFSNTTSASQWNSENGTTIVPLESPHNSIHLAVGGFDAPGFDASPIAGANGDMGENDTAGLDPIFFFHHCFIDYVFWRWQVKHGKTHSLDVAISDYPGTNTTDSQGPAAGFAPNTWLSLKSPLDPFTFSNGKTYTSEDSVDIEVQLGYTYGAGSLDSISQPAEALLAESKALPSKAIHVSGINRGRIRGSFVIAAYATVNGGKVLVGSEAVLSRWNVQGCMNCQAHLETKTAISLRDLSESTLANLDLHVELHTRQQPVVKVAALEAEATQTLFHVEVR
jgi:tyrosinase